MLETEEGAAERGAVLRNELGLDERLLPSLRCAVRLLSAATHTGNAAVVLFDHLQRPVVITHHGQGHPLLEAVFTQCRRAAGQPTG